MLLAACSNEPDAPHKDPKYALPALISDGMVLQRDTELNIWGFASQGSEVTVSLNGSASSGYTDSTGTPCSTLYFFLAASPLISARPLYHA